MTKIVKWILDPKKKPDDPAIISESPDCSFELETWEPCHPPLALFRRLCTITDDGNDLFTLQPVDGTTAYTIKARERESIDMLRYWAAGQLLVHIEVGDYGDILFTEVESMRPFVQGYL